MQRREWIQSVAGLAFAAGLAAVAGCATPTMVDMTPLQRLDAVLRNAGPTLPVSLRLDSDRVTTGSALQIQVASPVEGYVYLFQLTTDGKTLQLVFPNAMDGTNHLGAGQQLALPRPNWRMATRGPAGVGYLLAVVAAEPQDLLALQAGMAGGKLDIRGPYGAALNAFREVAP